ncbi:uncharacterized protein LOC128874619 [Hylaeus volcanicus]|uniref:uncharacterized protein LOC128874619 n=1 Tax=Hylaeus volcanicus TaxID=313075 RepID=UPI0023B7CCA2|nr:uncharacterized protein LOC128874619 [Hylaeus volcanicus]
MSVAPSIQILVNIVNVIKRFKFEDLEPAIMPTFPEISWTDIKSTLIKQCRSFTSVNAAQLIKAAIANAKFRVSDLRERFSTLQLIDASWHSERRTWYGHKLVGSNTSAHYFISRKIQSSMQDYFDSLRLNIDVKINTHNGITYISVKARHSKHKRQKNLNPVPIFIALFIGHEYFFSSKKNISPDIIQAIVNSMGYKKSYTLKLTGKDLKSLIEMCWRQKGKALDSENINESVQYMDASPDIKSTGIDFTQHKQRRKYAEKCFGDDPPTLESLVINATNIPWAHKDVSAKLPNEKIDVTWEFRSHNIATFLTKLMEQQVLVTPAPSYISNFMVSGKNQFMIRKD